MYSNHLTWQVIFEFLKAALAAPVVGLKRLETVSTIDSRTLQGYIERGDLKATTTEGGLLIQVEDAAKFFAGAGATLWTAAEARRKNPKGFDVEFTPEELASETWAMPDPSHFKEDVREHVARIEASNLGHVRNAFARRGVEQHAPIKPRGPEGGYVSVNITVEPSDEEKQAAKALGKKPNYRPKNLAVHRLVAAAHVPNPEGHQQVGHLDNNRRNNRASNLVWCTGKQNIQHGVKTGGLGRSTGRPCTKLTEAEVKFIRESTLTRKQLAQKFGITLRQVFRIRSGERWKNT